MLKKRTLKARILLLFIVLLILMICLITFNTRNCVIDNYFWGISKSDVLRGIDNDEMSIINNNSKELVTTDYFLNHLCYIHYEFDDEDHLTGIKIDFQEPFSESYLAIYKDLIDYYSLTENDLEKRRTDSSIECSWIHNESYYCLTLDNFKEKNQLKIHPLNN